MNRWPCYKPLLFLWAAVFSLQGISQNPRFDSLQSVFKNLSAGKGISHDTLKLRLLVQLSEESETADILIYAAPALQLADALLKTDGLSLQLNHAIIKYKAGALNNIAVFNLDHGDVSKTEACFKKSLELYEEIGDKNGTAQTLNNFGGLYTNSGEVTQALSYYKRSLVLMQELGEKNGLASVYNNLGTLHLGLGDIRAALDDWYHSLKLWEELGDQSGVAFSLSNIGIIYYEQGENEKAIEYYKKGLKISQALGDKGGIAYSYGKMGQAAMSRGDFSGSMDNWKRSLSMYEALGEKRGMAEALGNIGNLYMSQKELKKSLEALQASLALYREIDRKEGIASEYISIGIIYLYEKNYERAGAYADSALRLSEKIRSIQCLMPAEELLSKIEKARGHYEAAFIHYKKFVFFSDSLNNQSTRKASVKSHLKYEYETKEALMKEQQEKERTLSREKQRFQQIIIWSVVAGLLLVIVFAAIIFRSLKTARHQKKIIEEKQREILDSIHYAKRIQTALIPNEKYIGSQLEKLRPEN